MLESTIRIVPELTVLVGGVSILLFALFAPRALQWVCGAAAILVLLIAGVFAARDLGPPPIAVFSGTYAVDGAALWTKIILLGTALITVLLSLQWFRTDPRHGEYYTLLLFSTLGAVLMAGALDIMELILAALLSSATGFVLAAFHRSSKASGEAAIKYYLLGALTNGAFLYGTAILFGLAGSTTYSAIRDRLATVDPEWVLGIATALIVLGLCFKMGAAPAHQWMPDVAEGAPAPAAAFLTVAGKVGALLALARLVTLLPEGIGWRPLVAVLAASTMTLGNLAALWQGDVRRLLGWSSVSQTGYGLMAVVALERSSLALPALLFFFLAYALGNLAAFGVVVTLRGLTDRHGYRGLARTRPYLAAALVVSFLSFIGIPPLGGFTAKVLLFGASIEAGYTWLAVLAVANTVVSVAYYARVMGPLFFEDPDALPGTLGRAAGTGALACAVAVVGIGLAAEPFLGWFAEVALLP